MLLEMIEGISELLRGVRDYLYDWLEGYDLSPRKGFTLDLTLHTGSRVEGYHQPKYKPKP